MTYENRFEKRVACARSQENLRARLSVNKMYGNWWRAMQTCGCVRCMFTESQGGGKRARSVQLVDRKRIGQGVQETLDYFQSSDDEALE